MSERSRVIIVASFLASMSMVGFILTTPRHRGICGEDDLYCSQIVGEIIGMPLLLFSGIIFLLFFMSLFIHFELPQIWKKFALVFIPIAMICIFLAPSTARNFLGFEREWVTMLLAIIFFVVSVILIIVTARRRER